MIHFHFKKVLNGQGIGNIIADNKEFIFPSLCYVAGLLAGSLIFSDAPFFSNIMQHLEETGGGDFWHLFIDRFSLSMALYSVTVLLGMCLIGFPFINIIPLGYGFVTALKIAYYYTENGVKGLGYVLLMVAPEAAALMTVLIFCVNNSNRLSRQIYTLSTKKTDASQAFDFKMHLKKYCLYAVLVALISVLNAGTEYLLGQLIHL